MPIHGLKADGEMGFLVLTAAFVSYFVTGEVVSNFLFISLLAVLFFLEGLHFDIDRLNGFTRSDPFSIGFFSVFLLVPILSLIFALIFPTFQDLFLVLGVSSVSIGSPLVWSSISGGNGKVAETTSATLLASSIFMVPFLVLFVLHLSVELMKVFENLYIVLIPFLTGMLVHNSKFDPLEDMRFHFSKLAFWLIVLMTLVQLQLVLEAQHLVSIISYFSVAFVLVFYVFASFLAGYIPSKIFGINEKNSRSIGFVTSSRNVGIAFFLGSLISAEVVVLVGVYYFVRQMVGVGIADMLMHSKLKFRERIPF